MSKRKRPAKKTSDGKIDSGNADSSATGQSTKTSTSFGALSSFYVQLGIVAVAALILRLLNVAQTIEVPTVVRLIGDADGYFQWGEKIASGEWYGDTTFYQAPAYPYFLALLMKGLGAGVSGIRFAQALLGATGVLLLGIAARNLFSERVGVIAAVMLAVYPAAIFYDGIVQKTSLAAFLLCAFLCACSWLAKNWKPMPAYLVGLSLGLLILTRENALLWLPLVPVWLLMATKELPARTRAILVGSFVLGASTTLFPVAARNASLGGEWSPTTFQAGPNFYIGNNLQSDGIYRPLVPGHETPLYERADAQRIAEAEEKRELTAREVSRFWMNRSFAEIRQDPVRWVQLLLQKSFMVVNRFEVPDVESMHYYAKFSSPLKLAGVWNFGVLCPIAILGILLTRSRWRELALSYVLILSMVAAIVGFFILGRYRLPLVPLLIPFAGAALHEVWNCLRQREWSMGKWTSLAFVISAVVCNLPVHDEQGLNASSIMNVGVSAAQNGDLKTSIRLLNEVVTMHPDFPETHFNLGRVLSQSGRPVEALRSFQIAQMMDPNLVAVDLFMGDAFEQLGQVDAAMAHYQRALQIDPTDQNATEGIRRLSASKE